MERIGEEVHIETDEARSGSTPHIVRYVLGVSLVLAIVALSTIWITGALSLKPERAPVTAEQHALGN